MSGNFTNPSPHNDPQVDDVEKESLRPFLISSNPGIAIKPAEFEKELYYKVSWVFLSLCFAYTLLPGQMDSSS